MKKLKVCFIGLGSIAKRHIRNLQVVCGQRGILLQMDAYRHGGKAIENGLSIDAVKKDDSGVEGIEKSYNDFAQMHDDYDVIFITNPTEFHLETLIKFHNRAKHFFIEKPVVSQGQFALAKQFSSLLRKDSLYYVACPLRYNAVIRFIKDNISLDDVISIRSICSSYLPDWRPGKDYRTTYSAHRNLGGGVSIDLIHEWDYLTYLFGWPKRVSCMIGKKSNLEINSDDYAIYIAEFNKYIAELHLDYFGRETIRQIQLFTKDDTIIGDITNNKIIFLKSGKVIEFCEERDDYQKKELENFLNMMIDGEPFENWYGHSIKVLALTQGKIENVLKDLKDT